MAEQLAKDSDDEAAEKIETAKSFEASGTCVGSL